MCVFAFVCFAPSSPALINEHLPCSLLTSSRSAFSVDHYMIFNLCTDKDYDHDMFHNRVHCVDIVDHQVPQLLVYTGSYTINVRVDVLLYR